MREGLLELLAEPSTGAPLKLAVKRHEGDSIVEGSLTSEQTGEVYPIVRGIPRFVPPSGYADNFGKQWNMFRGTQLDSTNGGNLSTKRFDAETGWTRADLAGKWVLDAGCGAGRFAEIAAQRDARIVALDMSSAVEAAKATLAQYPNAEVVQASLLDPPFRMRSFDFAYSIGVMQHTPDPPGGIARVVHCLRPGGRFAFTIYARQAWTKLNAKYLVRPITRRLPSDVLLKSIEVAMPVLFPVMDRVCRIPKIGRLANFVVPVAVYVDRDEFPREQRYQEAVLDTFDMLAPRYDQPMTWQEVERALGTTPAKRWQFSSRVPVTVVGSC